MSRINKHKIQEQLPSAYFQSGNQSGSMPSSPGSSVSSSNASSAGSSPANAPANQNLRRVPNMFSPLERLEAFETPDFDSQFKPLLMLNLESIQTYRADCKYKRARR
ncbi:unnamed protein product [Brachionus calyciflorus]|uniref:Uncharacterized protein n=1 Tax=Brachionus calyciflorus TaxID=104777 RepID=A0A813M4K2_9BILA|nr:unnamed protein product [Brachionus calyciflorus]